MTVNVPVLLELLAIPTVGGIAATWLWAKRRNRVHVQARLEKLVTAQSGIVIPQNLLRAPDWGQQSIAEYFANALPGVADLSEWLGDSAVVANPRQFIAFASLLLVAPAIVCLIFDLPFWLGLITGTILFAAPFMVLKLRFDAKCAKFSQQLPDAIDLMVAVLRSGHSVSQSVGAVANEIANPLGEEFAQVLQRINLGQPLADSLAISTKRYQSYELDLIRRAAAIQMDVGGSLADLLDKTNNTLRERLKLARQLKVITAQSRLSAHVVSMLPVVLVILLNTLSPGYLDHLLNDELGRLLLIVAVVLEVAGIIIMHRMSSMRV